MELEKTIELLILLCKDEKIKSNPNNYEMRVNELGFHLLEYYKVNGKLYGEKNYFNNIELIK
jgi:hypothetical protein